MVEIMRSQSFRQVAEKSSSSCGGGGMSMSLYLGLGMLTYVMIFHPRWLWFHHHSSSSMAHHAPQVTDAAWNDLSTYISSKISDQVSLEVSHAMQDMGRKQQDALLSKVMKELQRNPSNSGGGDDYQDNKQNLDTLLPKWVTGTSLDFEREMGETTGGVHYHFHQGYQPALSRLIKHKLSEQERQGGRIVDDADKTHSSHRKIRLLEIGTLEGCPEHHRQKKHSHLLHWPDLFRQIQQHVEFEYHILEPPSQECAKEWSDSLYPSSGPDVTIHFGDPRSSTDLLRVLDDSGGTPFDLIIDSNYDSQANPMGAVTTLSWLLEHGLSMDHGYYFIHNVFAASSCGQNGGRGANCMMTTQVKAPTNENNNNDNNNNNPQVAVKQPNTGPTPTLLAHIMEYQRHLMGGQRYAGTRGAASNVQLHGVTSIQILETMFVLSKEP